MTTYRVLIACEDQKGLVFKISKVFFENSLNIISNNEFVYRESNRFFMRTEVEGDIDPSSTHEALKAVLPQDATIQVILPGKRNLVVFATKESHCIGDLLIRAYEKEIPANIQAVICNHPDIKPLVEKFSIPCFVVSHKDITREQHEDLVLSVIDKLSPDYLVFAKYMRLVSPAFVSRFTNRIINIHHSFLPAFIGANPYQQAWQRGVKIIGATAHFVTENLDQGPIIAQDIAAIDHKYSWQDMRLAGRDIEKVVLARALKLVIEDRVFIHDNKTILF